MSERQPSPPEKLFELLEFCGLRQRDIVTRLGVSKTLVSLWRSGQREITPDHYQALLEFANEVFLNSVKTLVRTPNRTPETVKEALAVFNVFVVKLHAAHAERDPTPFYNRLMFSIAMLHATFTHRGEPVTWDEDTLAYVEAEALSIADAARLLHSQVTAAKAVAAFQAQTATSLRDLLRATQGAFQCRDSAVVASYRLICPLTERPISFSRNTQPPAKGTDSFLENCFKITSTTPRGKLWMSG